MKVYHQNYYKLNKERILKKVNEFNKTKIGRATSLWKAYNRNDRRYGRGEGNLTPEWIVDNIFSKPCAHCGESDWHKIGCNRLDNSKPHTTDNVEPCCMECNCKLAGKEFKVKYAKKVYQYTLDGKLVKIWNSVTSCGESGFNRGAVAACCRGDEHYHTYKGYRWSYTTL